MEQTRHIVFRSKFVSICDVSDDERLLSILTHEHPGSAAVFARRGVIGWHGRDAVGVMDPNYAFFASENEAAYFPRAIDSPWSCTLIRLHDCSRTEYIFAGGVALSTPRAYLMQAQLLNSAWLGRASAEIDEAAQELLGQSIADARIEPHFGEHAETVRAIKLLVNRSISKPLTLSELARQTFLSPFTVSRTFHRETGISLRGYVKRLRLRAALTLMLEGTHNLTEIAIELGFYDEAHFSKAFHAEFGIAPALAFGTVCNRTGR